MNQLAELSVGTSGNLSVQRDWVIVTQVKSNRVVYFTDDVDYQPYMDGDWYYCSSYQGEMPSDISLRNCWSWRFNGGVFTHARETPKQAKQERLIEANRKALLRILQEKINEVRKPFLASCDQGDIVRLKKLQQAQRYLHRPEDVSDLGQLQNVALARNITMLEAAKLIVIKAEETEKVLLESERFREQLTQAIQKAISESQLWEIREWLLDKVYPELTRNFKFKVDATEPVDLTLRLKDTHRVHEITRLKVQLRNAINKKRAPLQSEYLQNDEIRKHKLRIAQRLLQDQGVPQSGFDYAPLEAYANGRGLSLPDAARLMVNSMAVTADLLIQTEKIKDQALAKIEMIQTLEDIQDIEKELESM